MARPLLESGAAETLKKTMRLRSFLPTLLFALAPGIAAAQSTTTTPAAGEPTFVLGSGGSSAAVSKSDCDSNVTISVTYKYANSLLQGAKILIFGTDQSSCPSVIAAPDSNKVLYNLTSLSDGTTGGTSNASGTKTISAQTLFGSCPDGTTKNYLICAITTQVSVSGTTQTDTVAFTDYVTVSYDSQQPNPANLTGATGGDGKVYLTWDSQSDVNEWIIYYRVNGTAPPAGEDLCATSTSGGGTGGTGGVTCSPDGLVCDAGEIPPDAAMPPDASTPQLPAFDFGAWCAALGLPSDDATKCGSATVSNGSAVSGEVRGLVNEQQYDFTVVARDLAGNTSTAGNFLTGTPHVVQDFYRRYRCAGGTEPGGFGCSTTTVGAVLLPIAGLGLLAILRRRRRA